MHRLVIATANAPTVMGTAADDFIQCYRPTSNLQKAQAQAQMQYLLSLEALQCHSREAMLAHSTNWDDLWGMLTATTVVG